MNHNNNEEMQFLNNGVVFPEIPIIDNELLKQNKRKEKAKEYYETHREAILQKAKLNYNNKIEYNKQYWNREDVKERRKQYNKKYYDKQKAKTEKTETE